MNAQEAIVVLITAPDEAGGASIGRKLVEERLAACCNLVPRIRSIYRWEERVCDEHECLMIVKTTRQRFQGLQKRVLELHPYEVPEILVLPVGEGSDRYLEWLERATQAIA